MAPIPKKMSIGIITVILLLLIAVFAFTSFTENPVLHSETNSTPAPSPSIMPTVVESATTIETPISPGTMHTTLTQTETTVTTTTGPGTSFPTQPITTPTTNIIPPSFSLSIMPLSASAQRGGTITYTMDITPSGGFDSPINVDLTVTALFFQQDYDLGIQYPPYPKRILYDFQVPGYIPPGTTLVAALSASGGGAMREEGLTITVI